MIKISDRLKTIAELVLSGNSKKIIDVGCDHALLDIYLLQNNPNLKIIASDNKEKPLESARKNILKYSFLDKIELILKDGIDNLSSDVDTVVISGMGAETIIEILSKDKRLLKNINRLVISSNNKYFLLRKNITELGYYINDEKIVFEDNKYYIVIEFIKGKKDYSKKDLYLGPVLLRNKNELFYDYYEKIRNKNKYILEKKYDKNIDEELNIINEEIE